MRCAPESSGTAAALTGRLEAISLFDLCQFLLLNRKTGTLTVRNGESVVRIYFEEGAVLDITDDAMRAGQRVLLGAVQWPSGTFTFDPTPPGVARRVMESTEAILLEAARTIDEHRSTAEAGSREVTQEAIFRERQSFAGELAEAFRLAATPAAAVGDSQDVLRSLLSDLESAHGTLLLRGRTAIVRSAEGILPRTATTAPEELLELLHLPIPREDGVRDHRFEASAGWFHLRSRRHGGELQILLAHLTSTLPRPDDIGLDPAACETLLDREGGLILWTGVPRGYRSAAVASWLGHSPGVCALPCGLSLWLEEAPRIAWEAIPGLFRHWGDPHGVEDAPALLDWAPERIVIDSVRAAPTARLALETAEAGVTTIAVATGLTLSGAVSGFLNMLRCTGVWDPEARLARSLSAWVGLLPLERSDDGRGVVAAQIVPADSSLASVLACGAAQRQLEEWAAAHSPYRGLRSEIERLEREGRIGPEVRTHLRRDLPSLDL